MAKIDLIVEELPERIAQEAKALRNLAAKTAYLGGTFRLSDKAQGMEMILREYGEKLGGVTTTEKGLSLAAEIKCDDRINVEASKLTVHYLLEYCH